MTQMYKLDKYTQVSVKEGIKYYGNKTVKAMMNEISLLNELIIFKPINAGEFSKKGKDAALNLITIIKQKSVVK